MGIYCFARCKDWPWEEDDDDDGDDDDDPVSPSNAPNSTGDLLDLNCLMSNVFILRKDLWQNVVDSLCVCVFWTFQKGEVSQAAV